MIFHENCLHADDKFFNIFPNFRKEQGMIFHEICLPADDSHEISCLICYFLKTCKIWNCPLLQIICDTLNACHTRRRFHVLSRSCLIFQSTVRTLENHDIFREKFSVTVSLQWQRRCHWALIAFYCVPTVFMMEILCALTVLSLRVHGAHSTCPALSRRCHCTDTVWKTQWHLQERRAVSLQMPQMTTAFAHWPLCAPTELLFCCRRPYCVTMVTLRHPLCALLGRRANAEWRCFVLSMLKVCTVARRSMRPDGVQWQGHCVAAVMLAFVLLAPRRSAIF